MRPFVLSPRCRCPGCRAAIGCAASHTRRGRCQSSCWRVTRAPRPWRRWPASARRSSAWPSRRAQRRAGRCMLPQLLLSSCVSRLPGHERRVLLSAVASSRRLQPLAGSLHIVLPAPVVGSPQVAAVLTGEGATGDTRPAEESLQVSTEAPWPALRPPCLVCAEFGLTSANVISNGASHAGEWQGDVTDLLTALRETGERRGRAREEKMPEQHVSHQGSERTRRGVRPAAPPRGAR